MSGEERRRESDKVLDRVDKKLDEVLDVQSEMKTKQAVIASVLDSTLEQVTKTNGRVTTIETWKENKNGEIRVICWAVGVTFAAVVVALVNSFIPK